MIKRIISVLVVFSFAATLFVGCGGSTGDKAASSASVSTAPVAADTSKVQELEPVELTLWVTSREQDDYAKSVEEKFLKENPHITLNKVLREGDPGNDFFQGVAAGNAPDLLKVSFAMMDKYMKAGILAPLNDYLAGWDESKFLSQHYLDMFTRDGKIYGLSSTVFPMFFGYNKKLFADAGISEPPKTWDEMLEVAKKLTKPENQQNGYNMLSAEWTEWFFQYYVWQAGGDLTKLNEDNTIDLTFTDPAVIQAANFYKELRKAKVTQSDITLKFDALVKNFAAGKAAMMPFASDWVSWAVSLGMKAEDIGLSPFPAGPSGKGTTAISGGCHVINAKTDKVKQDAAWKYIAYYNSKDTLTADLKNKESKGAVNPIIITRTDFKLGDVVTVDPEYQKVLDSISELGRLEFEGKAIIGKYVDSAVQKIIADPNASPEKEFKAAQELAEKEVMADYNKKIKEGK